MKAVKIVLMVIGGVVVVVGVLLFVIFTFVSSSSNKLVCESKEGNITLMYNDKEIVGYSASNITYDLDQQQDYAKEVGIDSYMDEFSTWFESNTSGTCTKEGAVTKLND